MDEPTATILLADASPHARRMAGAYLAQLGYDMVTADTGGAALALMAAMDRPPAMVLAEAQLPEMPGAELCRQIKARPEWRDIPVLILVGALAEEPDATSAGADGVLRKPLSSAGLQRWLQRSPQEMLTLTVREAAGLMPRLGR